MKKSRKMRDAASLNSKLIRRPIQKCFWLFLLPTFAAFCVGFLWPFIQGIYLSFCKFKTIKHAKFVGLDNYVSALSDSSFLHAFGFTALFTIVTMILINVLAFLIAYALTRGIKGSDVFRTVFFLPNLIGGIVLGYIWSMIFNGILAHWDTSVLLDSKYGFWGLVIMLCWQQIGYMMIIYIAGLQNVPSDLIEAAKIDGANSRQILKNVTLPILAPTITICTFLTLTNGFKLFDQNYALTGGNPGKMSQMLALNIYDTMYGSSNTQGVGQAKAVIFFILVACISLIQNKVSRSREAVN